MHNKIILRWIRFNFVAVLYRLEVQKKKAALSGSEMRKKIEMSFLLFFFLFITDFPVHTRKKNSTRQLKN
jgi:hypothetical protein